jgi:hypothetical protein
MWKIFYADGTRLTSWDLLFGNQTEDDPLPATSQPTADPKPIYAIAQSSPVGWTMLAGYEYYVWLDDQETWVGASFHQALQYLIQDGLLRFDSAFEILDGKKWKEADMLDLLTLLQISTRVAIGLIPPEPILEIIQNEAIYDPGLPIKNGWSAIEKRFAVRGPKVKL